MLFIQNFPFFMMFLPMFCAIACLLPMKGRVAKWLTLGCFAVVTVMSVVVLSHLLHTGESFVYALGHFPAPYGNEFRVGPLEAVMALLVSVVSLLCVAAGADDIAFDLSFKKVKTYYLLQNVLTAAMLALMYANDFFTAYVFVEIITIASVALVAAKPAGRTWTAALNYLFMGLVGSSLVLFSLSLLYGITGHLHFEYIHAGILELVKTHSYLIPLSVAAVMIAIGLAIKSALFPFHNWLPEAHGSSTTAASSILSGLVLKSYLFLLIKMILRVFGAEIMGQLHVPQMLMAFGVAAIVFGSWKAMHQRGLKRTLAYSSISQIGYICIALGLNTPASVAAACFHIIMHAVVKAMLFSSAGALSAATHHRQDYDSLRGAFWRDPFAGSAFILGGLALVGIPPLAGFASKFNIILAALDTPFRGLVVIAIVVLGTVMGAMIYFPFIYTILTRDDDSPDEPARMRISSRSKLSRLALCIFMILTLALGLFSAPVMRVIAQGLAVFG